MKRRRSVQTTALAASTAGLSLASPSATETGGFTFSSLIGARSAAGSCSWTSLVLPTIRWSVPAFLLAFAVVMPSIAAGAAAPKKNSADASAPQVADRAACSSLVQCKQPTEKALQTIAGLGYRWVDLSCLSWARHVSVPKLLEDFDKEAARVEAALAASGLKVANLTFDSCYDRPFEQYEQEFQAVVKLAVRLKTGLINLMAPPNKADRNEVAARMKKLQAIAARNGVIVTLETHCNQITERPADALRLCQQVPGLGLTLDPSHYYAGPN